MTEVKAKQHRPAYSRRKGRQVIYLRSGYHSRRRTCIAWPAGPGGEVAAGAAHPQNTGAQVLHHLDQHFIIGAQKARVFRENARFKAKSLERLRNRVTGMTWVESNVNSGFIIHELAFRIKSRVFMTGRKKDST